MTNYTFTILGTETKITKARRVNALSVLNEIIKEQNLPCNGDATLKIDDGKALTFKYSKTNNVIAIIDKTVTKYL